MPKSLKKIQSPKNHRQRNLSLNLDLPFDRFYWEKQLWGQNLAYICGLDEAGRGAWAGPVFAAAVILKPHQIIPEVDDSKKLTPQKREELFKIICEKALAFCIEKVFPQEIDQINILNASLLAMKKAIEGLSQNPDYLLIDGEQGVKISIPQKALVKGDSLSLTIGAASILAKVARDHYMTELEKEFPQFKFSVHKGYGTPQHHQELKTHGPAECHRKSFAPVRVLLG